MSAGVREKSNRVTLIFGGVGAVLLSFSVFTKQVSTGDATSMVVWGGLLAFHANQIFSEPHPFGRKVILRSVVSSYLLLMLNPLLLLQSILLFLGGAIAQVRRRLSGARADEFRCALPFRDRWMVLSGGLEKENSHSWFVISQRYAYDFIKLPKQEERDNESMNALGDYKAFGKEILAPAAGKVIRVRDNSRDSPWVGARMGWTWPWFVDLRGNHVVIEHPTPSGPVYSLLAHLKKGSVGVTEGQRVAAGELVGHCGNSGMSTEPHLHFHVQDAASLFCAAGVPICFQSNGEAVRLQKGDLVAKTGVA